MENKTAYNVPLGQRQLFLDDFGTAKTKNLKRTMHQPKKKGAVIRPDLDSETPSIQTRTAPIWDPQEKVYKMWDCTSPNDLYAKGVHCWGYYESKDGLNWCRPAVGQVEWQGSRENNYVTIRTEKGHLRIDLIVYDPTDPDPARRYKGALPNIGFAVSPDGRNWKMLDVPGVPSSDEYNFSFDEKGHLFILTVKHGGPHGRAVWLSTSKDFEHWTKPELIFHSDDLDQELGRENIKARVADPSLHPLFWVGDDPAKYNVDVYNMGVFRYEGLYIGMPAMYHSTGPIPDYPNTDGFHLVQLVCSRDLKTWIRLGDRKPFIGHSPMGAGAYDMTQIIGPSAPVVRGDELWFYYTGLKYRGADVPYKGQQLHMYKGVDIDIDQGAICLAVLRRDGFISLDAGPEEGILLTKQFKLLGSKLYVNVNALKGEVRAEILDTNGKVLAASAPLKSDLSRGEVEWEHGDVKALKGQVVSIRFRLCNASLYSFWLED